ncbi:MAG: 3-hydroxyacyl-CoA dehydrogenase [Gammaproteobacteria bacterium]
MSQRVAIIGVGLVGRAWATVFARAGYDAVLFDPADGVAARAAELIRDSLPDLHAAELLNAKTPAEVFAHVHVAATMAEAVDGTVHVQESGPERVEVKRDIHAQLDRLAPAHAVLASSTSGIPASQFTESLPGRSRCLVAHPINPPHIIPLVEIIPAPWTEAECVERTRRLMTDVGQSPIRTTREIDGFVANRLQGALLSEAFRLVEDGVCTVADIDTAIADGLGLRWSFIGPFETIDLNSPSGVRGYCDMLGELYYSLAKEQADPRPWSQALVAEIERQRRAALSLDDIASRQAWRDRRLAQLVAHRREAIEEDEEEE